MIRKYKQIQYRHKVVQINVTQHNNSNDILLVTICYTNIDVV